MDLAGRLEPAPAAVDALSPAPAWAEAFGDAVAALALPTPGQGARWLWASRAWQRALAGAELPPLLRVLARAQAASPAGPWRLAWPQPGGELAPVLAQSAAVEPAAGTEAAVLWLRHEPGPAHALQRHLEDRERLLFTSRSVSIGEMASTLAHEINQPIGTVGNVLRGLAARLATLHEQSEADPALRARVAELQQGTRLALDQTLFAARVIGRIREYTQSRQPSRQRLDLAALARDSAALLDWAFAARGVPLNIAVSGEAPVVGDAVMLQQVIVNLLRNALDAHHEAQATTPAGAAVALTLQRQQAEWELAITDRGGGISREAEDRLFVPFVSSKPDGMGLGLKICRSFIELHQGRLWFTRNPAEDGGGCTFHIALRAA
jgi:signal transduction histidine kinase